MDATSIADSFSGFLTPLIGVIAAYIAFQQYKTNKNRERREARHAQLSVYTRVKRFLNTVDSTGNVSEKTYTDITEAIAEADFLFGDDITEWLSELQDYADEYRRLEDEFFRLRKHHNMIISSDEELRKRDPQNFEQLEKEQKEEVSLLKEAHVQLKEKFSKYLKL